MAVIDFSNATVKYSGPFDYNQYGYFGFGINDCWAYNNDKQTLGVLQATRSHINGTTTISFHGTLSGGGTDKIYLGYRSSSADPSRILYEIDNIGAYNTGDTVGFMLVFEMPT